MNQMSDAFMPLPYKKTLEGIECRMACLEDIKFFLSPDEFNSRMQILRTDRLLVKLENKKNIINQPDPDNMLDGKQGKISVKFKWLDAVEEKIKWHKWAFDVYETFNEMYGQGR